MPFPNPATQFKKGNPGRPKGRTITERLRALLEKGEINGVKIEGGKQIADLLSDTIIKQALAGDYRFIDMILQRVEGPAGVATGDAGPGDDVTALREHLQRLRDASRAASPGELLGRPPGKRTRVRKPHGPA